MILMTIFNPKRKKQIKNALKKGDVTVFRKPRAQRAIEETEEQPTKSIPIVDIDSDAPTRPYPLMKSKDKTNGPAQDDPNPVDAQLLEACEKGDIEAVKDALRKGADADMPHLILVDGRKEGRKEDDAGIWGFARPIKVAKENGHTEIVEFLKRLGVKE